MDGTPPAEIPATPPSQTASRLLDREALYERLDAFPTPSVWISAPAGYGKTSLAKGYLGRRGYCTLWHQATTADADLASFFLFLIRAYNRAIPNGQSLPEPTPESLLNLPFFARDFAEALFSSLPVPFALVLDDFHDIPLNSPTPGLMACAIDRLPPGGRIVFISRQPPSPPFARHLANSTLYLLEADALRLDLNEAMALGRLHGVHDPGIAERAYELVNGWAAGLVLMLRHGIDNHASIPYGSRDAIFDYFLSEVLASLDKAQQDFLIDSAFLPCMTAASAARQTGNGSAGTLLARLHRENFFTSRCSDDEACYTYHPLFRDFLLRRAILLLTPMEIAKRREHAAELLEEAGKLEEAAQIRLEAENWQQIARMICQHGQELFCQGRFRTLQAWLDALPGGMMTENPWLSFWMGATIMLTSPEKCRHHLDNAHRLFLERNDWPGALLACTGALESFFTEWGNFADADPWIVALERLLAGAPEKLPPPLELRVVSALKCVLFRRPAHPMLNRWIPRARSLAATLPDPSDRLTASFAPAIHALWHDPIHGRLVFEDGSRCADAPGAPVMLRLSWWCFEANYLIFRGETEKARLLVEKGLALAAQHGLHALDSHLHKCMIYVALATGNAELADNAVQHAEASLDTRRRTDVMHLFHLKAHVALLKDRVTDAISCLNASLAAEEDASLPFGMAVGRISAAWIWLEAGQCRESEDLLDQAECIMASIGEGMLQAQADLVRAHLAIQQENPINAAQPLRRALATMRACGYPVWDLTMRPQLASILAGAALELGIEREFLLDVIRSRRLRPEHTAGEHWPWPVRIETLGRFMVCVDGASLAKAGKAQKKTLDMLKTLIAHGGEQVTMTTLADALWPDAEGDAAENAFKTTLHRLRRLLGHDDALLVHEGRLSLNPRLCHVDAIAFRRAADEALARLRPGAGPDAGANIAVAERALDRYQGHFLPSETELPSFAALRESLRSRFHRLASATGALHEAQGEWQLAADTYRRCLEIDPLAEPLYRQLIVCLKRSGQNAEAIATFHRCREILAIHLGTAPSAATRAAAETGL